jgi:hypothetical protein
MAGVLAGEPGGGKRHENLRLLKYIRDGLDGPPVRCHLVKKYRQVAP